MLTISLTELPLRVGNADFSCHAERSVEQCSLTSSKTRNLESLPHAFQFVSLSRFLTALRSIRNDMCSGQPGGIPIVLLPSNLSTKYLTLTRMTEVRATFQEVGSVGNP